MPTATGNGWTLAGTLLRHGEACTGWVTIHGERIVAVGRGDPPGDAERHDGVIAPGLIDLQVNGIAGHEVTGGDAALDAIEERLLACGVTGYLPTLVSRPAEEAERAVLALAERVADPSSPALGLHLEGPLLSPRHCGAHDPGCLLDAADGAPAYLDHPAGCLVTLAPELPGALDVVARLSARGATVALGHSAATAEQASAAADAGARAVTHLFNAMRPLHHREPGLAGVALIDVRLTPMVIADGIHVVPPVLRLVHRAAGERVVLVSDAVAGGNGAGGEGELAGRPLSAEGERVTDEEGRLAGSAVLLDEAVRRYGAATGASLAEAWAAASERPARLVGHLHGLAPGLPADLVLADAEGRPERVMRAGRWVG